MVARFNAAWLYEKDWVNRIADRLCGPNRPTAPGFHPNDVDFYSYSIEKYEKEKRNLYSFQCIYFYSRLIHIFL